MVLSTLGSFFFFSFFFKRDTYVQVIFFLFFFFTLEQKFWEPQDTDALVDMLSWHRSHAERTFPFYFFTSWITSSSSSTWSLPTFWGLCLTDEPHTSALKEGEIWNYQRKCSRMHVCRFTSDILLFFSPTAALDPQGATKPLKLSYHACTSLTHSVPRGRVTLYGINMSTDWWSPIWRRWSFTSSQIWGYGCDYSWRVVLNQQRTLCKLTLRKTTKPD